MKRTTMDWAEYILNSVDYIENLAGEDAKLDYEETAAILEWDKCPLEEAILKDTFMEYSKCVC